MSLTAWQSNYWKDRYRKDKAYRLRICEKRRKRYSEDDEYREYKKRKANEWARAKKEKEQRQDEDIQ